MDLLNNLGNFISLFVQQFSIAGQIKAVSLEICPAIENCWTKPYPKWELLKIYARSV